MAPIDQEDAVEEDLAALLEATKPTPRGIDAVPGLADYVRGLVDRFLAAKGPLTKGVWEALVKQSQARYDRAPRDWDTYRRWARERMGPHVG